MSIVEIAKAMEQFKDVPGVYEALRNEMYSVLGNNLELTSEEVVIGVKLGKFSGVKAYKLRTKLSLLEAKQRYESFFEKHGLRYGCNLDV